MRTTSILSFLATSSLLFGLAEARGGGKKLIGTADGLTELVHGETEEAVKVGPVAQLAPPKGPQLAPPKLGNVPKTRPAPLNGPGAQEVARPQLAPPKLGNVPKTQLAPPVRPVQNKDDTGIPMLAPGKSQGTKLTMGADGDLEVSKHTAGGADSPAKGGNFPNRAGSLNLNNVEEEEEQEGGAEEETEEKQGGEGEEKEEEQPPQRVGILGALGNLLNIPGGANSAAAPAAPAEAAALPKLPLPFYCDFEVDFFKDTGREPFQKEVEGAMVKINEFLNALIIGNPTFEFADNMEKLESIMNNIGDVTRVIYDPEAPDHYYLEFDSVVDVAGQNINIREIRDIIAEIVDHADFALLITQFLWQMKDTEFYNTQEVKLGCSYGTRPAAPGSSRLLRRRLEESATMTFGGSHKVASHDL